MNLIYPIGSSSKGNAVFVGTPEQGILFDCGVGIRVLQNALKLQHIPLTAVRAVFVTHEHSDHIKGLCKLSENIPVSIYSNVPTLQELIMKKAISAKSKLKEISQRPAEVCGMEITPFRTSHDSVDSMGYHVTFADGKRFCLCTDLGYVSQDVAAHLQNSDIVLLESNYEEELLVHGSYPPFLKDRIRGDRGHLSNADCAAAVNRLAQAGVRSFILGHLSEENNRPELALAASAAVLAQSGARIGTDCSLWVAPRMTNGKAVQL